ncbi:MULTISPECIES: hypothetical protein [Arsenophonus]|uniref:hypothetical protein n=1 Tax=Arsenophonus TaxID=637 RepID=UPI003879D5BA
MNAEQRQKIAIKIYESTGLMYDKDDPVFALALINTEVNKILLSDLEEKHQCLINAIEELPTKIEASLEKLIAGLEEAEKSYTEIDVKHRNILNNQLDETKLEIRCAIKNEITGGISEAISHAKKQLNQLENQVEDVSTNCSFVNDKSWIAIIIISTALIISICFNAIAYIFR